MGFTVLNYSHLGLQPQNCYLTIKGSYQVKKIESLIPGNNSPSLNVPSLVTPYYTITFSIYFKASPNSQVFNEQYMSFNIQSLPEPANLYSTIYEYIKGQVDPYYQSNQQTLTFSDD